MTDQGCIIYGYAIDGTGGGQLIDETTLIQRLKADDLAWVHLDATHPETRPWLENNLNYLDPLILDALLAEETRPRIMDIEDGTLMILRGMNFNDNADPEDMISIRIWIDNHRIVTLRRRSLKAIYDMKERLEKAKGPKDSGEFIAQISARLFERMEPVMTDLDERIDNIEENLLKNPSPAHRQNLTDIRQKAIIFRRYIAPQKDVMAYLRTLEQSWINNTHKRQIQESLDRLIRYIENLDAIRERAQIIKDEITTTLSDRLNKNLYILSIISAIFLPLGFFTGLMGINIGGMPGVDDDQAFWVFSGILTLIVALQILIFKKMKWF